ncbi:MAG TPA: hypothetical protein VK809_04675 [Bacteroidia bacterium]|jgi:hypothetical protein|nr:hypothetical protein [Bacteroidia bacterium]
MDCTPFTVDFTGTPEELFAKMQQAASEQNFALSNDGDTISVKVLGFTLAKANFHINGQQVTITIIQNPPGYPCEKTQHIMTKFITGGKAE